MCKRARGAHVLIVDDDVMLRTLAARLLEQMGCRVSVAATGELALAAVVAARDGAIDIVLLDRGLWQETGEEVCLRLRGAGFDAPIVAMSGDGIALDARLRNAGFDAAMNKPFSADDLYACVEAHVGRKHGGASETA